jgi:uncharacterized protein involved in outer membrane biogenesis
MPNKNNIILILVILALILFGIALVFGNNYKRNTVEKLLSTSSSAYSLNTAIRSLTPTPTLR